MNRFLPFLTAVLLFTSTTYAQPEPTVDSERLESTLLKLATFGRDTNGVTNRVAFSDGDIAGREYVKQLMDSAGLEVSVDHAGNIIGHRPGTSATKKAIAFGSHIDMVPGGGNYDGCVGSLGAIEVARTLQDNNIRMEHPLELIIFSNEEGGLLGSRALSGEIGPSALSVVNSTGFSMAEGLKRIGGDPEKITEVAREKGSLAAFLELHIEQGGTLEKEGIPIGVVEGIVGIKWWDVEISGFANHAGTTPMDVRQDALLAAARFIIAVNEEILRVEGKQVGTVGRIDAEPGAPNVIPGKVVLSLEIRDLAEAKINSLFDAIQQRGDAIAKASNTQFTYSPIDANSKPALTDQAIQTRIGDAADALGLAYKKMPSGAGHDAQDMALIAPTGMIFVPSRQGISHSPDEFTSAGDMANGANVLLHTILLLDKDLE